MALTKGRISTSREIRPFFLSAISEAKPHGAGPVSGTEERADGVAVRAPPDVARPPGAKADSRQGAARHSGGLDVHDPRSGYRRLRARAGRARSRRRNG